ncbi:MAG: circularly permuted type 2 ATP-grasp protein [Nitrososphaerales archaeon]
MRGVNRAVGIDKSATSVIPYSKSFDGVRNEVFESSGTVRPLYRNMITNLERLGLQELQMRWQGANRQVALDSFTFQLDPIRFRPVPTDWLPRLIPRDHWERIAAGVSQRMRAINKFLLDLYCGKQEIVPEKVVYSCKYYYPELRGVLPAEDLFAHIYGIDLVHMGDGNYVVLEDNLRIPSGISYQLKCCEIGEKVLPELGDGYQIIPHNIKRTYLQMFASLCDNNSPRCVLLTDSKYGSAFFEHRYLSRLLGFPLVEGSDLYVGPNGRVWARALGGDFEVDLIYRRVEELDLFVRGLTDAYRKGKVVLVNALGTGAADDKLVFLWVPEMIRHYLGEEPILQQATSYYMLNPEQRRFVLQNLSKLVLKTRDGYGGLGVYIVPDMGPAYQIELARMVVEQSHSMIAQETLNFSKHLVFDEETGRFSERYVDLRVYAVQDGKGQVTVLPGGLTRVSLPNSRITNNSSGGLCKGTWVVR